VVIEHPVRAGWKLTEGEDPAESSVSFHRFRLTVEPKKTATLVVKEYRPLVNRYQISNITDNDLRLFVEQKTINAEMERALRKVMVQKDGIAALDAEVGSRRSQMAEISGDQQRLRENMKALKGSAEEKALVERYVRQMNQQEDRVQQLQHEVADLQQKRIAAQKTLNETIDALQMDVTL
jgi:chromosome segregation ATPase